MISLLLQAFPAPSRSGSIMTKLRRMNFGVHIVSLLREWAFLPELAARQLRPLSPGRARLHEVAVVPEDAVGVLALKAVAARDPPLVRA